MRHLAIALLAASVSSLPSRGAVAAEPQPQPAANATVLVLPFSVSDGSSNAWIGRAVQRDLEADLMRGTRTRLLAPSTVPPASDSTEALEAARHAGASIVVFGQMQSNGTEVRLTGQVIDVATQTPLGPMKATGLMSDLFHLEDAIAGQTLSLLPKELLNQEALDAAAKNQLSSPAAPAQTPPQQTAVTDLGPTTRYQSETINPPASEGAYVPPPTQSSYQYVPAGADVYSGYVDVPTYTYGYACPVPAYTYPVYPYPGLACPFPFYGFGVVIGPSFGFDHHHDFDHHDFGHGFDHPDHGHWQDHGNAGHGYANHPGSSFAGGAHNPSSTAGAPRYNNGGYVAGPRPSGGFSSPVARGGFAGPQIRSAPHISTYSGGAFHSGVSQGTFGGAFHGGVSHGSFGGAFHGGGFHASSGGFHGGSGAAHGGGGRR